MHGVMRKTYSLLALKDMMTALHYVRGKTRSFLHEVVVLHYMSEGRRAVSSAQGMIVLLPHASEGRRAVSYTGKVCGDVVSVIYWDLFLCQM